MNIMIISFVHMYLTSLHYLQLVYYLGCCIIWLCVLVNHCLLYLAVKSGL